MKIICVSLGAAAVVLALWNIFANNGTNGESAIIGLMAGGFFSVAWIDK